MTKAYIYRNFKVRRGVVLGQNNGLSNCFDVEIDGEGFGPKTYNEVVPKHCVFTNKDLCSDAIRDDIDFLERLAISVENS